MRTWSLLYRKECLDMIRHHKWIWVPLVFLLLGVSQPITMKFLPDILAAAGNLPEGTTIQIPTPSSGEILGQTIGQFNSIGMLLLVLATMGTISSDISSGVAAALFTRTVSPISYLLAKWAAAMTLTIPSFLIGYGGSWYYTVQLFGSVEVGTVLAAGIVALGWFCLIVTLAVVLSLWFRSGAAAAFTAIGAAMAISLMSFVLNEDTVSFLPSKLIEGAQLLLIDQIPSFSLTITMMSSIVVGLLLLVVGGWSAKARHSWLPHEKGAS
ncbi:ABC transporter permease [Paenibacillus sp. 1001270B_150601_E10]|uniref:ABC transporter permease n=1 Tax=Paenibacillus sp. 1001270B_150601_E10 TaxID=2787079 RepID=UPI00189D7D90|nr:ABC transporter permease subunit [Paenibacillus sp. 1001270B_150601_E10]